jgi:hypothetical protein
MTIEEIRRVVLPEKKVDCDLANDTLFLPFENGRKEYA